MDLTCHEGLLFAVTDVNEKLYPIKTKALCFS